jgi:hypothetical protein
MSYQIKFEPFPFEYFPACEPITSAVSGEFDVLEDRLFARHRTLRRILVPLLSNRPPVHYLLHWDDKRDLQELDQRISEGQWGESDFENAILCEPRTIICRHCGAELRAAVVDPSLAIPGGNIAERLTHHKFVWECPICHNRLGLYVVELLGENNKHQRIGPAPVGTDDPAPLGRIKPHAQKEPL